MLVKICTDGRPFGTCTILDGIKCTCASRVAFEADIENDNVTMMLDMDGTTTSIEGDMKVLTTIDGVRYELVPISED